MVKKNIYDSKRTMIFCWGVFFLIFVILNIVMWKKVEEAPAWCDYRLYWELGKNLFQERQFSILNLSDPLRGTILPLIFGGMYYIGISFFSSEWAGFIFGSSLIYATLFAIVIPTFIMCMQIKCDWIISFGVLVLSLVFWRGLFLYPLSDVLAFGFILSACCLIQKQKQAIGIKNFLCGVGSGICAYCAYNIRSIYMFSIVAVIFAIIIQNRKNIKKLCGCGIGYILGTWIIAIPQIILNKYLFDAWSIANISSTGIILPQLKWGFEMQRYETYVGIIGDVKYGAYPNYGIVFEDPIGIELMKKAGIESFDSIGEYICFVFKYFFDVIGIYARHIVNVLCPCYPELYVEDINRSKVGLALSNSIILYYGLYTMYYAIRYKKEKVKNGVISNAGLLIAIIIPCLAIIPGAVEMRFFYPMYVLGYIVVLYGIKNQSIRETFVKKWYVHIVCFVLVMIPLWAVWANTFANMRYNVSLFTRI